MSIHEDYHFFDCIIYFKLSDVDNYELKGHRYILSQSDFFKSVFMEQSNKDHNGNTIYFINIDFNQSSLEYCLKSLYLKKASSLSQISVDLIKLVYFLKLEYTLEKSIIDEFINFIDNKQYINDNVFFDEYDIDNMHKSGLLSKCRNIFKFMDINTLLSCSIYDDIKENIVNEIHSRICINISNFNKVNLIKILDTIINNKNIPNIWKNNIIMLYTKYIYGVNEISNINIKSDYIIEKNAVMKGNNFILSNNTKYTLFKDIESDINISVSASLTSDKIIRLLFTDIVENDIKTLHKMIIKKIFIVDSILDPIMIDNFKLIVNNYCYQCEDIYNHIIKNEEDESEKFNTVLIVNHSKCIEGSIMYDIIDRRFNNLSNYCNFNIFLQIME